MLKITCKICGTPFVWDDFKPTDIKCPRCGEKLNVHASLKDNIEYRERGAAAKVKRCPSCKEIVTRLWFIRCPECRRWIFSKYAISGKWFAFLALITAYLMISATYFIYFH